MKTIRLMTFMLILGLVVAGCSQQQDPLSPQGDATVNYNNKDGTEFLGEFAIADGSGIAEGGVGLHGTTSGMLDITVPAGASIEQVLLYWVGGSTTVNGDNEILIDGNPVTGALIGGPTLFYGSFYFNSYRADITGLGLVTDGANSFEITEMEFDWTGATHDENNGVGMIVVYDDGSASDLQFFDGLDMAYFEFSPTLDATAPVTFDFAAATTDRTGKFVVQAGSVGAGRANHIIATSSAGPEQFDNPLGSTDGEAFDSIVLDVFIPAGDTQLTVQLFSTPNPDPLGASMGWTGSGLSVPAPELGCLGDYVWHDMNMDGIQDDGEEGIEDVTVYLYDCEGTQLAMTTTDMYGEYLFCDLMAGDYMVKFMLPDGYVFSPQDVGGDDAIDSDADPSNGETACVTLTEGETNLTVDAGMYMPPMEGCSHTIGYWKNHAGFGPQDDEVTQYLPLWLGDAGGTESYQVTDAGMAVDFLKAKTYGSSSNGITKLYQQLLASKLSVASGASDDAIADAIADADAFLADYNYMDWVSLDKDMKNYVLDLKDTFDDFNNGDIGPGHCDDMGKDEEMDVRLK